MPKRDESPEVLQAFKEAAAELGLKFKNSGSVYWLDKPFPKLNPDPAEAAKAKAADCGDPKAKQNQQDPNNPDDPDIIGGTKVDKLPATPSLSSKTEGSDYPISAMFDSSKQCPKWTREANYQVAKQSNVLDNVAHTLKAVSKLKAELGLSIQITSGYRSSEHNACVGGSKTSSHTSGYAIDLIVNGRKHFQAFKKMKALAETGKLQLNQAIWEVNKAGKSQGIIHLDFKPTAANQFKMAETVGGSGPFHNTPDTASIDKLARLWGVAN